MRGATNPALPDVYDRTVGVRTVPATIAVGTPRNPARSRDHAVTSTTPGRAGSAHAPDSGSGILG